MSPETVLITGSCRGIGLGLVKQFLKLERPPIILIASCMDPENAKDLQLVAKENKNIKILQLDVSQLEEGDLSRLREDVEKLLEGRGLNLLINNAAIVNGKAPITLDILSATFTVNAFAPLLITKTLLPLLQKAASSSTSYMFSMSRAGVLSISAMTGSITRCSFPEFTVYKGSKAAMNMFTKNLSVEYQDSGILFLMICPGGVDTDMLRQDEDIWESLGCKVCRVQSVEEACGKVIKVMDGCSDEQQGAFLNNEGEVIPW